MSHPPTIEPGVQPVPEAAGATSGPPRKSKIVALLAVIACAGCCALPLLIPLGLLTTAGVAAATTGLLVVSGALFTVAGLLWGAHHRLRRRRATAEHGCSEGGGCSCSSAPPR